MKRTLVSLALFVFVLVVASTASAQLMAAKDGPIVYGHHHVAASNIAEHKRFWADTLGGTAATFGANNAQIVKFPNVLIFFRDQKPTGGTIGTTANHIGLSVPNLRAVVDKVKANGFKMITRSEVAATQQVVDDIAPVNAEVSIAFALGPDDVKVELLQNKQQTMPVMLHHVHFFGQQNAEMRAWYAKVFGAKPRDAANFLVADLPGVALNFTASPTPTIGTTGRAVDHIGFEVKNLEAFCKKLEEMGIKLNVPYRSVPALGLSIAFITDPWGTSIELTEGLDKVS
jgi:catechol 2,3-dioxygenase-like lactoylglutathione lyase family enzyme